MLGYAEKSTGSSIICNCSNLSFRNAKEKRTKRFLVWCMMAMNDKLRGIFERFQGFIIYVRIVVAGHEIDFCGMEDKGL